MPTLNYYNQRAKTYWEVVSTVSIRNIKLRYKNSLLGFLWGLLNPLIFLSIFVFIFSQAFADIENYPLFALTGLIFWIFFSTTSNQVMNSLIESAGILKSLNIPPIIFPISAISASLINLLLSFVPFFGLMLVFGFRPDWVTLMMFPLLVSFSVFTFGFSLVLASLNVYFRDVSMLWSTLLPALMYFTPVAYSSSLVPEKFRWIMKLNPLAHYIESFRDILYYHRIPEVQYLISTTILSLGAIAMGILIFKKLKKGFISNF
ncbi:MAG: ABC transporter permease [Cytophagaceae bacterium]